MKEKEARAKFRQVSHQHRSARISVVTIRKDCMHQDQASSPTAEERWSTDSLARENRRVENNFLMDAALTPSGATRAISHSQQLMDVCILVHATN